ncbi:phosphoribosyltransferase family protein [Jonquetella sp. BV3C21]|uniref:phosphoribosyltransferase family protein n=1 Tax=Jonquetella sp. BV3C21 TaxID=1111126 RepID=UPI0003AD867B|nr:phosphoribosyltransferase family protein [Jonquetella sp. BV3C21]ERL23989.1 putative pur operon repressor PurR [Jonquetella sp. BV3C21]
MRGQRIERLIRITSRFLSSPSSPISLTGLADDFSVSKTVISDDVAVIDETLQLEGFGRIVVDRGRAGGAAYVPSLSPLRRKTFLDEMVARLGQSSRRLPAGFIYYADVLFHPATVELLGLALASDFLASKPTIVMTSEVKGIPLGLSAARALGLPLALCRFRNRASDGPAVCVHYPTPAGEARAVYMGTKQLGSDDRVLIVDDFVRGGSTVAGMCQVSREFGAQIVGVGAFILADEPAKKAVSGCQSLLRLSPGRRLYISGEEAPTEPYDDDAEGLTVL